MRFNPGWKLSVTVLLLLPLLFALGCWQLQRATEKRDILQKIDARRSAAPLAIGEVFKLQDMAYRQVSFSGRYLANHVILLDNRIVQGRFGYEWVQLFRSSNGALLAVSRGWLPGSLRRDEWPTLPAIDETLMLTAEIYVPLGEPVRLAAELPTSTWPKRMQNLDVAVIAQQLGEEVFPYVLRLREGNASALQIYWQDINVQPAKHTAYAVQWFAMALALLAMYLAVGFGWITSAKPSSEKSTD
jgi:surfeit locus 1 family protein